MIYRPVAAALLCALAAARGADAPAKFLGAQSCSSTSCHGGGGTGQNQFLVWSLKDFHSQRPAATLATARSKQIAEALEIKDPTADARCTTCHAPLNSVPENLRGEDFKVSDGVSCESCHGAAGNWIRAHTRKDFTRADRAAAGMRDLQNLYVRANTCVACHQNVDDKILAAGHPELIFELDGQSAAEPKHWSAAKNGNGAQAWLVGQAVALREMSWQISHDSNPDAKLIARRAALVWLLQMVSAVDSSYHSSALMDVRQDAPITPQWADKFARTVADNWNIENTRRALKWLSLTGQAFQNISNELAARRAERLVLALDRLTAAENNHKADAELNRLFKLAQSVPDFDPKQFAAELEKFSSAIQK
jgi:hypothetical protein